MSTVTIPHGHTPDLYLSEFGEVVSLEPERLPDIESITDASRETVREALLPNDDYFIRMEPSNIPTKPDSEPSGGWILP